MKTKTFESKVLLLDYTIVNNGHQIVVYTKGGSFIARVNIHSKQLELAEWTYCSPERLELLQVMTIYTMTEPEDREEEKRYYLRKILIPLLGEKSNRYFCKPLLPNYKPCVDKDRTQNHQFQTIFTESEIAEMDISGFEKVEVIQ